MAAAALTQFEAALIGATRLEPITLAQIAAARGTTTSALAAARVRAERKLAAWLRELPDPTEPDQRARTARPAGTEAQPI